MVIIDEFDRNDIRVEEFSKYQTSLELTSLDLGNKAKKEAIFLTASSFDYIYAFPSWRDCVKTHKKKSRRDEIILES